MKRKEKTKITKKIKIFIKIINKPIMIKINKACLKQKNISLINLIHKVNPSIIKTNTNNKQMT